MTETLVIRLRASDEAPASWLIVDGTGARSGPVHSGPVADALSLAQGRRTVIILPAAEATLAAPELPVRGGARIAQAVPFALEEQLASDLDTVHFAVGTRTPPRPDRGTPVVMVSRPVARPLARHLGSRWHPPRRGLLGVVADSGVAKCLRAGAGRCDAARAATGRCRLCARCATAGCRARPRAR